MYVNTITQLADTNDSTEFRSLITSEAYNFRFFLWCHKTNSHSISEKQQVVNAMCLHYSVLVSLLELEQLRRELAVQKFATLMEIYPQVIRTAFQPSQCEITSKYIQDLFVPALSPIGSNKRTVKEAIVMMWMVSPVSRW